MSESELNPVDTAIRNTMNALGTLLRSVRAEVQTGSPLNRNLAIAYRTASREIRQIASSLESAPEDEIRSVTLGNSIDDAVLQSLLNRHLLQPISESKQKASTYSVLKEETLNGLSAIATSFDTDAQGLEDNARGSDEYKM